jgi:hypothetical protein
MKDFINLKILSPYIKGSIEFLNDTKNFMIPIDTNSFTDNPLAHKRWPSYRHPSI